MNNPTIWLFIIGLFLAIILTVLKVRGGMLIAIAVTAIAGIPMGQTTMANSISIGDTFAQLPQTFGAIFSAEGFPSLFSDMSKLPIILLTIFAFSMSDTFDTIGTFIGTGRRTGIFSAEDEKALENGHGFSSKMDKALFADSIATSIGAICGTSNTTTYVESSAGIAAGGRTGLTSVVVAICFALSAFLSPVISAIPSAATGVLRFRIHGVQLLHLLRHRRRLHHLLPDQDLQGQGQGSAPGDLGCVAAVHSGLHHHRDPVVLNVRFNLTTSRNYWFSK